MGRSGLKKKDKVDSDDGSDGEDAVNQATTLLATLKRMQRSLKDLRMHNTELQELLEAERAKTAPRRIASSAEISILQVDLEVLKQSNKKLKAKIKKLEDNELEAEAADILEDGNDELVETDKLHIMKKLLRRFSSLMATTTLAEENAEECPCCLETLKPGKAYSFDCEHPICRDCWPKFQRGADETVKCPMCRKRWNRRDASLLYTSETERWDELLDIAKAFSAIDKCGEMETSEEEEDENAIIETEPSSPNGSASLNLDSGEEEGDALPIVSFNAESESGLISPEPRIYSNSPMKEKRKMMENIAREREAKRLRTRKY